jgi:hypothetical protein
MPAKDRLTALLAILDAVPVRRTEPRVVVSAYVLLALVPPRQRERVRLTLLADTADTGPCFALVEAIADGWRPEPLPGAVVEALLAVPTLPAPKPRRQRGPRRVPRPHRHRDDAGDAAPSGRPARRVRKRAGAAAAQTLEPADELPVPAPPLPAASPPPAIAASATGAVVALSPVPSPPAPEPSPAQEELPLEDEDVTAACPAEHATDDAAEPVSQTQRRRTTAIEPGRLTQEEAAFLLRAAEAAAKGKESAARLLRHRPLYAAWLEANPEAEWGDFLGDLAVMCREALEG